MKELELEKLKAEYKQLKNKYKHDYLEVFYLLEIKLIEKELGLKQTHIPQWE